MKIRHILAITIVAVLASGLGWWFLRHGRGRQTPAGPRVEIRFAHFGGSDDQEFWRRVIVDFEKANPEVHVVQEYVEGGREFFNIRIRSQATNQLLPETALVPLGTFRELAAHFEDVSGLLKDRAAKSSYPIQHSDLESTGLKAYQVNQVQRGLPFSGGSLLIFLNRKSFEKASAFHANPVPLPSDDWTVVQFLRTAEKLTCDFDRDGEIDQYGLWLPQWSSYLPFIWLFGAELTDEEASRWTFFGPSAERAMRFYRQLATGDRVALSEVEAPQLVHDTGFLTGKVAMCVNGPWFLPRLEKSNLASDYGVAPIPHGPGGQMTRITWDGVVMRQDLPADRRQVAWRYIEWALSEEVQNRLARRDGALPARVESQQHFVSADPSRRKPFVDAISYSRLEASLPIYEEIDRAIARYFGEAADPGRAFDARAMLDALARDPAIVGAFAESNRGAP